MIDLCLSKKIGCAMPCRWQLLDEGEEVKSVSPRNECAIVGVSRAAIIHIPASPQEY